MEVHMRDTLFRAQAVHSSLGSSFGDRVFYQPLRLRIMVTFLGGVFIVFLMFAVLAPLTQTERVRGFVTPALGEVKVYGARSGVLLEIHVREGARVARGDVLATLVEPGFDVEGRQASDSLLRHVDQQIAQLLEQLALLKEQNAQVRSQLVARVEALQTESTLLWEEHEVVMQRLQVAEQDYQSNVELYQREAISQHEHNQAQIAWYAMQQQAKSSRLTAENRAT